jgi:Sec-independent protein translocase protein TatA
MSFFEMIIVLILGVVILKPEDLKSIAKFIKNFIHYFQNFKNEMISTITEEDDHREIDKNINFYLEKIITMSGKYKGEYEIGAVKAYYHKLLLEEHLKDKK